MIGSQGKAVFRAAVVGTAMLGVAACAAVPTDPEARAEYEAINDPFEPFNRGVHSFNQAVDKAILRPTAIAYREVVPEITRYHVNSLLRNLASPVIFANDLLQGEIDRAMVTLFRFAFNVSFGFFGLNDPATEAGLVYHDEDFGQTLAVAGVGEGPYLVLPLLGPSNPRDVVGRVADWFMDPFTWVAKNNNWGTATAVRTGLSVIDTRESLLDPLDEMEKSSLDYYATLRTLYRQRREAAIANQDGGEELSTTQVDGSAFDN